MATSAELRENATEFGARTRRLRLMAKDAISLLAKLPKESASLLAGFGDGGQFDLDHEDADMKQQNAALHAEAMEFVSLLQQPAPSFAGGTVADLLEHVIGVAIAIDEQTAVLGFSQLSKE